MLHVNAALKMLFQIFLLNCERDGTSLIVIGMLSRAVSAD